jgi:NAD+ kinase
MPKINITHNALKVSRRIYKRVKPKLEEAGYEVTDVFDMDAELTICIGGDGSLLTMLADHDFPSMPIVGINTGHLGFFQDLDIKDINEFVFKYRTGQYMRQSYRTVYSDILDENSNVTRIKGLNEIVIRGNNSHLARLNISIGESFIEQFVGDGVVVSTPAGSTAYNYALGGSIVDPRLDLLMLTPIAPVNTTAYRSFTSSILLPPDLSLTVHPDYSRSEEVLVTADGKERCFTRAKEIRIGFNESLVTILRFKDYDFWKTVKQKIL